MYAPLAVGDVVRVQREGPRHRRRHQLQPGCKDDKVEVGVVGVSVGCQCAFVEMGAVFSGSGVVPLDLPMCACVVGEGVLL